MVDKTREVRTCRYFNECQKTEEYNGKWLEHWRKDIDKQWLCVRHYNRLINSPKTNAKRTKEYIKKMNDKKPKGWWNERNKKRPKGWQKKYTERQIVFLGKLCRLSWIIRKGNCTWCPNNIHDGSCKVTDMHHYFYIPIMVWACTIELCSRCHRIETIRLARQSKVIGGNLLNFIE